MNGGDPIAYALDMAMKDLDKKEALLKSAIDALGNLDVRRERLNATIAAYKREDI